MSEYRERRYRHQLRHERLVAFEVAVKETDLFILADSNLATLSEAAIYRVRGPLEGYIARHPEFLQSLVPLPDDPLAPSIVREMLAAGQTCGVGPMAAVAGAIAEAVGRALLIESREVVVENGGDCFVEVASPLEMGIFAGSSVLSEKLAVRLRPERTPLGVCTSSGTVGHSLSFGRADAVTVIAPSAAVADAAATRIGNRVKRRGDLDRALAVAQEIEGVLGVVIIIRDAVGVWGEVELVEAGDAKHLSF
ncbi:MAG TPA: UPF0280 family protein [Syntrophobacteria bacterium]|nr:UPF0280 family protein [Syntrophobacteria bacterium]